MTELEIAKRRALYLLGGRDYSRRELYKKLLNNYSPETCEKVVAFAEEYGYLDEERYAKRLARSYIEGKKYGARRAALMMKQKGLDGEVIEAALEQFPEELRRDALVGLVERKYYDRIFGEGLEGRKELQKVIAALARRGYSYGEIKNAIDTVRENAGEEEDFDEPEWLE